MPSWLWPVSILGTLWNVYGVYQFAGTLTRAGQAAMTAGMTSAQAERYLALPGWMTIVFAMGVFGGLAGSILLALRRRLAQPVFAASLAGYVLLFAGDSGYGVFAAMPGQLVILFLVVLIAAVLFLASRLFSQRSLLH